jgi:pSer/pThr/pTyr-binding forkhead associated (FHA) protein
VALGWDPEVSRTHAQLELVGGDWTIRDDGLSRNGTFVNGERVTSRRRLEDRDTMRVGHCTLLFRAPLAIADSTVAAERGPTVRLTEAERRVLVAMCRPLLEPDGTGVPASNREIAEELHLTVSGVKTQVRSLFAKLGIDDLPQYRKRVELVRRALESGVVGPG